jgi:protein-tyrosine phosphatase
VPFIGEVDGWRILLLEFPHQIIPVGSDRFIYSLLKQKIRPLIAHPERNKAIMAHPEKIEIFTDAGCWLQITAGSLSGRFGAVAQEVAFRLIEDGCHCLAATDAHNLQSRPPRLSEARDLLRVRYGDAIAHAMVVGRPGQIVGVEVA